MKDLDISQLHGAGGRRGGGGGRVFGHGGLRLVLLQLIADKPRHGYELIKAIEDRLNGAYSPSPGVIYPTLTLLEEMGHVTVTADGGRKLHTLTDAGRDHLAEHRTEVDALLARMASGLPMRGGGHGERPAPIESAPCTTCAMHCTFAWRASRWPRRRSMPSPMRWTPRHGRSNAFRTCSPPACRTPQSDRPGSPLPGVRPHDALASLRNASIAPAESLK